MIRITHREYPCGVLIQLEDTQAVYDLLRIVIQDIKGRSFIVLLLMMMVLIMAVNDNDDDNTHG